MQPSSFCIHCGTLEGRAEAASTLNWKVLASPQWAAAGFCSQVPQRKDSRCLLPPRILQYGHLTHKTPQEPAQDPCVPSSPSLSLRKEGIQASQARKCSQPALLLHPDLRQHSDPPKSTFRSADWMTAE